MPAAPTPPDLPGRYVPLERVGRGGIGEVWRVRDGNLVRDLAVKLLRRDRRTPEHASRLAREALLTGRLQHPGVPPVVERGTLEDGGPFFVMKLVAGRTLRDIFRARTSPRDGLGRALSIVRQTCDAVGYAHSQGVIHRDLKPANVMVGEHGEVQVLDWGMARLLAGHASIEETTGEETFVGLAPDPAAGPAGAGEAEDPDATRPTGTELASADPLATMTRAGFGMGTPAYMPPEQARGDLAAVDARSDVFGLGAILCVALTGDAPFADDDAVSSFRRASAGELSAAFAAIDRCGAEGELRDLCKRCLAPNSADRPADGAAVADALRRYEDGVRDRLQRERSARAAAEVRAAEAAKRRRVWVAATAAVVLLLLAAGWANVRAQAERDKVIAKDAETAESVKDLAKWTMVLRDQAQFDDARAMVENARGQLAATEDAALAAVVTDADRQLAVIRELDAARSLVARGEANAAAGPDGAFAAAFRGYGADPLAGEEAAVGRVIGTDPVAAGLVAALDAWAAAEPDPAVRGRLLRVAQAAGAMSGDGPADRIARDAVLTGVGLDAAAGLAADLRASTAALLAVALREADSAAAAGVLAAAGEVHRGDFWLHLAAADAFADADPGRARGHLMAALAVRPDSPVAADRRDRLAAR